MLSLARLLVILGIILIIAGGLIYLMLRLGIPLGSLPGRLPGRLPGDIRIERNNYTCVFALGTSILLSIILTVILNIIVRFLNK
jgi:hypothetical protein